MKDKLRDVHLNSCLICSKLDNSVSIRRSSVAAAASASIAP
jgi:hypothetical protein